MKEQELTLTTTLISWSGSFPQNYEDNLKFIFGPYARDLAGRVELQAGKVLELACGTGQVTERLAERLSPEVELIATDLSMDMMDIAKHKIAAANVTWQQADMCAIPFEDGSFDVVICQFGMMFATDKDKAFQEMYRVLKTGGRLLFNTWGLIQNNSVFNIFNQTLVSLMNFDLGAAEQGPFSMQDEQATLRMLTKVGFKNISIESVLKTGESPTAAQAAKGFFQGSQLAAKLKENNPVLGEQIQVIATQEFIKQLGDQPLLSPLQAWVFQAFK